MQSLHKLNRSRSMYRVAVIGCGGTGSALIGGLPFLHQALIAIGHPGLQVIVADGDKVSPSNCVRQPFSHSEIGLHKSTVLVNRLNLFWGLNWQASTEYVTRKTEGKVDILISCVDTRSARFEIILSPLFKNCTYWLDLGNTADGGQFVLGQPRNSRNGRTRHRLRTVTELFPEIADGALDKRDNLPSCSAIEALVRQEPFLNQVLAYYSLALLARLFRHGEISYHGGFLDLKSGRIAPLRVSRDTWPAKPAAKQSLIA
jgi:sulfur-carrier protein adenylyltransferase/sulfurtransferase